MKTTRKHITEAIMTDYFCDYCNDSNGVKSCCKCEKDICRKHTTYDDRDYGDYPNTYCLVCWEIGQEFRDRIAIIESDAFEDIKMVEREWKEKCLEKTDDTTL